MSRRIFRLLWPCVMNVGWRERNQQDATNLIFVIKLYLNIFRALLCPSSGEQECALPHMVSCSVTRGEQNRNGSHILGYAYSAGRIIFRCRFRESAQRMSFVYQCRCVQWWQVVWVRRFAGMISSFRSAPTFGIWICLHCTLTLTVLFPSYYSAEHHMRQCALLFSWWWA